MSRILRERADLPAGAGGSGGERPPAQTPAAGETPPPETPPPTPAPPPASPSARGAASPEDGIDLSDLPEGTPDPVREIIRRERRDRTAAQREAREARTALDEKNRAEMSELERERADKARLEGEVEKLTTDARIRAVREGVSDLAQKLGLSDPKLAARLLEMKPEDFTDNGEPKDLEKKLEALKREYPAIATRTRGSADAGAGRSSGTNETDINARIRERLGR